MFIYSIEFETKYQDLEDELETNKNEKPGNIPKKHDDSPKHLINDQIRSPFVLLVVENSKPEKLSISEALSRAKEAKLDLILINDKSNPPIVKIFDYGKFLYQIKRKNKSIKKNVIKVKSITIKPQISEHDIQWKANQAIEWFKGGDRVQFLVRAAGRMSERIDLINQVFIKFSELVTEYAKPKEELKKISKIQYVTYFFPIKK